jgi:isoleucyl-tRNA synthetase
MAHEHEQPVSYKETLNLPTTDFPIRPNAAVDDAALLERWEKEQLYQKAFEHNHGNTKFIMHDGPPYANGHLHLGHAYNKIIKDILCKAQRMSGKHVPVVPGWDCHGLPIEFKVTQENPTLTGSVLKKKCRDYANNWVNVQCEEFKKLGVVMHWDRPYKTMDPSYEAAILRAFGSFVEQGYIERKNKTVPWCFHCQTVLASAEIEYQERKDPSVYVLFELASFLPQSRYALTGDLSFDAFLLSKNTQDERNQDIQNEHTTNVTIDANKPLNLVVWTTTPWTLPLNRAVFVHPKATYAVLEHEGRYLVVGSSLVDKFCTVTGIAHNVIAEIPSQQLIGLQAKHPFIDQMTVPVLADGFVSLEDGTACVHSAPGCGPEDYEMGLKYGLEVFSPLSAQGTYTKGIKPEALEGMSITDGQWWVLKTLQECTTLLFKTTIKHSFPHCWRCHNGLMFRATQQWFFNLAQSGVREQALAALETITFIPERSVNFLRATLINRLEWCLSRQRQWGVPIPALLCSNYDYAFIDHAFIEKVAQGIECHGIEYWDTVDIASIKPPQLQCPTCGSFDFIKEHDILDVWFDSGVSHYAVLKNNPELAYPADVYVEGLDQHRGWFQSSLLTSIALAENACFKAVITHGFTVDEKGRKMSKSLGNVVVPQAIIKELGTDGLRLWVSSIAFEGDAVVSSTLLANVKEVYRKIRNTCRFLLSNLYDFEYEQDAVAVDELSYIDQHALLQLVQLDEKIKAAYQVADITFIFHELGSFCAAHLSSLYLDVIKDRLYTERADGPSRRSAQTVCWYILDTMTRLMAPILSFTAELVTDHYQQDKKQSVHLQSFATLPILSEAKHSVPWNLLLELRSALLKALELEREKALVKHSLEAHIVLYLDPELLSISPLKSFFEQIGYENTVTFIKEWLIVSQVTVLAHKYELQPTYMAGLYARVTHADGVKCPRCWQWDVTDHIHHLCRRCQNVV